ncbi:MAG: carboxy terminal-processing peptidase, partial [Salegentibacter sp.]
AKRFDSLKDYKTNLTYTSLPYEEEMFKTDTVLQEKRERWHESLSRDVYMEEAVHVLSDMKMNNIHSSDSTKLADSNKEKIKH